MICKALAGLEEERLRRVTDEKCEKVVRAPFGETYERANGNFYTIAFEDIKHTAVKTFLSREANDLLDDKM